MFSKEQERSQPMFHYFQMEYLVPESHTLRLIDEAVDFSFVQKTVAHCYCPDNGRPAVNPVNSSIQDFSETSKTQRTSLQIGRASCRERV